MEILAVSDAVWQSLIGVLGGAITTICAVAVAYIALRSKMIDLKKDMMAASAKVEVVAVKIEEVRHLANSLTEQLVASTEKEALVRGGVEERARADALKEEKS